MNFSIYSTFVNGREMYGIVDELNDEVVLPEYDSIEEILALNIEGKYYFRVGNKENNKRTYRIISINIISKYFIKVKEEKVKIKSLK